MAENITITANWLDGSLSNGMISRQYDNNRYRVQFINYPLGEDEDLSLYLIVWMKTEENGQSVEQAPIELDSDQWIVTNYYTQFVQNIQFQLCVRNESGTFEAHSPIFNSNVTKSLSHDGSTQEIYVDPLFDAYKEYVDDLVIGAGAVVIDSDLDTAGAAADAKATGDAVAELNERLTQYDSIVYTEGGGEGGEISGKIIQFDSVDGTPESIGVDGSGVTSGNLTVCGVNLFPKFTSGSASGLTWTADNDGVISFTGTPTADVLLRIQNVFVPTAGAGSITAALFNNLTNSRLSFWGVNPNNSQNWQVNMTSVNATNTLQNIYDIVEFRVRIPKDVDWTGLTIKPMLVYGDTAPATFIPYDGQTYAVTLGTDGKVNEELSYKSGINTIFSNFGAVTAYMPVERRTIKEDFEALSEVVDRGDSFYKYEVSGNAKYIHVYYKSGKNWVKWQLHNVPAPNSNSDTWQIGRVCGLDENLENLTELVRGGEFELAFKEHGAADYCGGNNHGDETTDVFKLFIDGQQITDLSALPTTYTPFNRIDAFEIATVNRCDTPSQDILTHQKIWVFEDGKVTVRQTIKFLENLSVDGMLVCMFAALRATFPYGIRKGGVSIEDMTSAGFEHISTKSDDIFYMMYGDVCTAKITAKTDNPEDKSVVWINDTTDLNKLYYGYYGQTNSAAPTSVTAGTVCTEESVYEVAYTA